MTYEYVIVGGGLTAASAVEGIRSVDPVGRILMLSRENHPPYHRPPLHAAARWIRHLGVRCRLLPLVPPHRSDCDLGQTIMYSPASGCRSGNNVPSIGSG